MHNLEVYRSGPWRRRGADCAPPALVYCFVLLELKRCDPAMRTPLPRVHRDARCQDAAVTQGRGLAHCSSWPLGIARALVGLTFGALLAFSAVAQGTAPSTPSDTGEVVRLRQPSPPPAAPLEPPAAADSLAARNLADFEVFTNLQRFGTRWVNELAQSPSDAAPTVPSDYLVQVGDELTVLIWGTVEADLRLVVDRSGRIAIPRVGPVSVVGVRFGDLQATIARRVAQVFKGFELSVSLGRLRGVRLYLTGHVARPGAYVVPSLSTVLNAVMRAGGPSAAGSYRNIQLRRPGQPPITLDLYKLILEGERSADALVQPEDVIHVSPAGVQVALRGSVNNPAIYELKPDEVLSDVLRMAGGLTPLADRSRLALERVEDRRLQRVREIALPAGNGSRLQDGDVLSAFSAVDASLATVGQNKRVRIEGEVRFPGEYVLPPTSTLQDALRVAGGLTSAAFVYGASFTRESVRLSQQENLERAIREIEGDIAMSDRTRRGNAGADASSRPGRSVGDRLLVERLRGLRATGRIVLQLAPDASELPDLVLESGDRLVVPPRPTSVGVFGSVFNSGNYLYDTSKSLGEYLRLAGGPTKGADGDGTFVVRANGQVVSSRQGKASWWQRGTPIEGLAALPGDTLFVPEDFDRTTFLESAKDWTQLLFQLGLGAAGIKSALQ